MESLASLSDKLWRGEHSTHQKGHHPFAVLNQIDEVAEKVAFYKAFSNITIVETDDGAILIDTGSFHPIAHKRSHETIRSFTKQPVHTAVYTHGHVDHAYGLPPFLEEARTNNQPRPAIIGHAGIPARMDRYIETAGYNAIINTRQFGAPIEWPTNPIYPDTTYLNRYTFTAGSREFRLHHARGETDDHTWVFIPDAKVLCTGDLFIWAAPNAGNPQKVQRYIKEWGEALKAMAACEAEVLLPGHGLPVIGAARVKEALLDTATYLESLYTQTVTLMNQGATVDELIHTVKPPEDLAAKPYLQPIYDEPEFVVRNIHRCLGGWYSGIPAELKPAPHAAVAHEIARLANGVDRLLDRARELHATGDTRMACHLLDWAVAAEPENRDAHRLRAEIYEARTAAESSTMAKGIYAAAARDSQARAGGGTVQA